MLDSAQLRTAWQRYGEYSLSPEHRAGYETWWSAYLAHVRAVDAASVEELSTRDWQEKLWRHKAITPLGPGDSVNVSVLYEDREVVERIAGLKKKELPTDPDERAKALQVAYNELLELVATRDVRVRPAAKLKRIFAALFPRDLTCVISYDPNRTAAELLLPETKKRAQLELQVLMRHRLREVLGQESDLAEHVRRSTFCWWLHENFDALSTGGEAQRPRGTGGEVVDAEKIVLWPFGKQWKGNAAIKGFDNYYRDIVQASVARVSRDDVVEILRASDEYAHLQPKSLRAQVNLVKGLGFLDEQDGLLYPTRAGEELLEGDQPDVLVRALLERVFGYAHLLKLLADHRLTADEIASRLQTTYPNWTSSRAPRALLVWAEAIGLADQDADRTWSLSEYGRDWAGRLPDQLPTPPRMAEVEGVEPILPTDAAFPAFPAIYDQLRRLPETAGFVFDQTQVAALDAGWRFSDKKRFVILSGLSGTGKTEITRCYARAVCALMGIDVARHLEVVPVSPDWRDPTSMFGYFNALHADPTFQAEPTLRLILRASADPSRPYFLILDEMNLARVERYLAPMLSSMETGDRLALHANEDSVNGVPPSVHWPRNLYIAGTVNMDESTHAFSDKVLDRAFTLEFWDVDLPSFFQRRAAGGAARTERLEKILIELHDLLKPVRRHFGYRAAGEVLDFVAVLGRTAGEIAGIDLAIFAKILPRLRGEESGALTTALEGVAKLCNSMELSKSGAKVEAMLDQLRHTGMTKFWA